MTLSRPSLARTALTLSVGRSWPDEMETFALRLCRPEGRSLSFEGREYLRDIYRDHSERLVLMKAAQTGGSLRMLVGLLWDAAQGWTPGYYLDTLGRMKDFVQGYVHRLIRHSPGLQKGIRDPDQLLKRPAWNKQGPDNIRLMTFCENPCYFRAMQVSGEVRSIALDSVYLDEVEELQMAQDSGVGVSLIDFARDRLLASRHRRMAWISQPGLVNFGIHKQYLRSDQKRWLHRCNHGHTRDLVADFNPEDPLTIRRDRTHGHVLICGEPGCDEHLYRWDEDQGRKVFQGDRREWVPAYPDRETSGYQLSQLYAPFTSFKEILSDCKEAERDASMLRRLHISVRGAPTAGNLQPFSEELIRSCGDDSLPFRRGTELRSFAAVDFGKTLWWVAGRPDGDNLIIDGYGQTEDHAEVIDCLQRFNAQVICDAYPETRIAREVVREVGGILCEFASVERPRKAEETYTVEGRTFTAEVLKTNREDMIDELHHAMMGGWLKIASRGPAWETLVAHCLALVKQKDPRTGKETFVKGVENHLGFCLGYLLLLYSNRHLASRPKRAFAETVRVGGDPLEPY